MNNIPGYASAQRQWENMEPSYAAECECPSRFECEECGDDKFTAEDVGKTCPDPQCGDPAEGRIAKIVEVPHGLEAQGCPEHGWCPGCTRRNCEDCGGDDWDDR